MVASKTGLGQRVTADSPWVPARALAVPANTPVVISPDVVQDSSGAPKALD